MASVIGLCKSIGTTYEYVTTLVREEHMTAQADKKVAVENNKTFNQKKNELINLVASTQTAIVALCMAAIASVAFYQLGHLYACLAALSYVAVHGFHVEYTVLPRINNVTAQFVTKMRSEFGANFEVERTINELF